jgi:hypothetical protein
MSRAPFIVIDGKLYRWKDILDLRRAQLAAAVAAAMQHAATIMPDQITGASDLGEKLEQVVHMALNEVVAILGFSLEPDDRAFAAILKAKTTILSCVLNAQVRIDERRFVKEDTEHDLAMEKLFSERQKKAQLEIDARRSGIHCHLQLGLNVSLENIFARPRRGSESPLTKVFDQCLTPRASPAFPARKPLGRPWRNARVFRCMGLSSVFVIIPPPLPIPPPDWLTEPTIACPPVWTCTCSTVIFCWPLPRWRLSASSNIAKARESLPAWFKCSCAAGRSVAVQGDRVAVHRGIVTGEHLSRNHVISCEYDFNPKTATVEISLK